MAEPNEHWRAVPWSDGRYLVSDRGRVMSLVRGRGSRFGAILKTAATCSHGHQKVSLHLATGVKVQPLVHSLVMEAFVGPRPDGHQIDHIDFNPRNNALTNLRYVTPHENSMHSARAGRKTGERRRNAKLTPATVRSIRAASGTQQQIARDHGVSQTLVSLVRRRILWRHV